MNKDSVIQQIETLGPWFHNLHLPDGHQTAPEHFLGDFPQFKWLEIAPFIADDLRGLKALDIGCNAGYYTLELAKRGAEVTAIDIDEHYLKQARWAAEVLELKDKIEFRRATVYDLARETQRYDLIWFMGVLYHLRYPLLALDIVRRCCKGEMIFQTMTAPGDEVFPAQTNYDLHQRQVLNEPGWPKMAFIEHRLANDPTNWWAPNHAAVEAMLRAAGFGQIKTIAHEIYSCRAVDPVPESARNELNSATSFGVQ
jgi:tRNA (mo5U34)-methyltransferase